MPVIVFGVLQIDGHLEISHLPFRVPKCNKIYFPFHSEIRFERFHVILNPQKTNYQYNVLEVLPFGYSANVTIEHLLFF